MGRKRLNKLAKGASDTKNESYPYYGPPAIFSEEGDSVPQHAKPVIRIPKSTLENHKEEDASLGPIRFHTEFVDQGKTLYTLRNEKSVSAFVQGSKTEAPVFDVVTEFSCNSTFGKTMEVEGDVNVFYVASLQGRRRIDIRSPALIAALQRVVRYWPGLILTIATVRVKEPFSLLVHHAEELIAYQEECASRDQLETCEKELDASNHLNLLNQYMEENIMPAIRAERQRHERGFVTFEYLWLLFKPGTDVIVKLREQDQASVTAHDSGVVKSLSGGPGQYKDGIPIGWEVVTFYLGSDGSSIGRVSETTTIPKFEGEMPVSSLPLVPVKWAGESPDGRPWVDVMSGFGAKSFQLLTPQCAMHAGRSMEFPYEDVDGLVMIDYKSFLTEFPDKRPVIAPPLQQTIGVANCNCPVCAKRSVETTHSSTVAFAGYDNIEIGKSKLTDHQAFLFGRCTYAFHFRTRMWQFINVANLTPARFKSDILETLVMKSERMNMLRALAKKYMQPENTIGPRRADFWSADFIEGKGKSQIILLHGRPGVGKTYTAECMAEYTRRPLLTLTCADIGTEPEEIEHNLTYHFGAAKEWGAIVLIDEADIYMEVCFVLKKTHLSVPYSIAS